MNLGAFSITLPVKNVNVSFDFYSKLGFSIIQGKLQEGWVVIKNGDSVIGLFEDLTIDKGIITFNPGWNQSANNVDPFQDVRSIYDEIVHVGLEVQPIIDSEKGPAYLFILDPDKNPILIDQQRF